MLSLNSPRAVAAALEGAGLAHRIGWIVGRGDVRPKPDPEGLELLLRRHRVGRGATVFVGDSAGDRACALAAGVRFLDVADVGCDWRRRAA